METTTAEVMDSSSATGTRTFRKTSKGLAEIETRANKLPVRLRSVLIMVDGRLQERELHRVIGDALGTLLQELLSGGFIEPVGGTGETGPGSLPAAAPAPAPKAVPAAAPAPAPAPAAEAAAAQATRSLGPTEFLALRREAVRSLTDQIGPMAEALAVKMENARGWNDLKPLLVIGAQILANTRGRAAAEAFAARFIGT